MSDEQIPAADAQGWREMIARYQKPDFRRSLWQTINSFLPYFILWYAMIWSLDYSYWLTLLLVLPAAGFLVRIFIIFHDCGHGSFFSSQRANDIMGIVSGLLTFTPYYEWRHNHAIHHATGSDLDNRGTGDVWMLTVDEYMKRNRWSRFVYRFYRYPLVMFGIGPLFMFFVSHRFTSASSGEREKRNVYWTNVVLALLVAGISLVLGLRPFLLIMLPTMWLAGIMGVWLFYVQHQFKGAYWAHHEKWDFFSSALKGSSFYDLPALFRWFSGNIGFHHIHHLSPKVPNYFLPRCQKEIPLFWSVQPITLISSFQSLGLRLWDENQEDLVGFRALKTMK